MRAFFFNISVFLISSIFLTSCYPEWKLAKSYIESNPDLSIMILPTNYVFKTNLKINEIDTVSMNSWEIDSALIANSMFLKDISDSIILETFINSMIVEFEKLGFKVYTENQLDSFLFIQSPAYIFNIAQLELEEHYSEHEDQENFGDYTYHKKIDLDAVSFNGWYELSHLNDSEDARKLFYASETITDVVTGYFTENMLTGDVKYRYMTSDIDLNIIYRYCGIFGRRYAGYTFDYIMNNYITENWIDGKRRRYYMKYNRENNTLDPTERNRFIEMDE